MLSLRFNTPARDTPVPRPVRLTPHHLSAARRFRELGQNTEAIAHSMHLEEHDVARLLAEVRDSELIISGTPLKF